MLLRVLEPIFKQSRANRGFTLIEVLLVVFVLSLTAVAFSAIFPSAQISRVKAAHMSYAVSLAQQKIEELRSAGYTNLDLKSQTFPLPDVPGGVETYKVTQYSPRIKKIEVSITWDGYRSIGGSTSLVTFLSDCN